MLVSKLLKHTELFHTLKTLHMLFPPLSVLCPCFLMCLAFSYPSYLSLKMVSLHRPSLNILSRSLALFCYLRTIYSVGHLHITVYCLSPLVDHNELNEGRVYVCFLWYMVQCLAPNWYSASLYISGM